MATAADLTTYMDAARTALQSYGTTGSAADRKTIRVNLMLARSVLPELPQVADDGTSISYSQALAAIESIEKGLDSLSGTGIVYMPVEFGSVTDEGDF